MAYLYQILLIVHVMGAMLWFGASSFLPRSVRRALSGPEDAARDQLEDASRIGRILGVTSVIVLLSGLALAGVRPGGFDGLPVRFHIAFTFAFAWVVLELSATRRILSALPGLPLEDARARARRLPMVLGIEHLLFTVALVLMLWRI